MKSSDIVVFYFLVNFRVEENIVVFYLVNCRVEENNRKKLRGGGVI